MKLPDALSKPEARVRRRHVWITLLRFPLTDAQAERLAGGDESKLRAGSPLDVTISAPVCETCQLDWDAAPYSCSGKAPEG
jgi:hypothetical protein